MAAVPVTGFLCLSLLVPATALAQGSGTFDTLGRRVEVGERLEVQDQSGERTKGFLSAISLDDIIIRTATGPRRFPRAEVREVSVRDGLTNGMLIGLALGFAAACGTAAADASVDWRPGESCLIAGIVGGGLGVGIGATVDALHGGRAILYRAEGDRAGRGALPRATGLRFTIRW
jgi:hypothetical protein